MNRSIVKIYLQLLNYFIIIVIVHTQNADNNLDESLVVKENLVEPPAIQVNSIPEPDRPEAIRKSKIRKQKIRKPKIVNEISNKGEFKFEAPDNQNQVMIEGHSFDNNNGTKELLINGILRVFLISTGFNSQPGGNFQTFDDYDQYKYRNDGPGVPENAPIVPTKRIGVKSMGSILG